MLTGTRVKEKEVISSILCMEKKTFCIVVMQIGCHRACLCLFDVGCNMVIKVRCGDFPIFSQQYSK